jgi:hypothetical protein
MKKIIIFILSILLVSCEEIIYVDLTDNPGDFLIVEGGIYCGSYNLSRIQLTNSMAYYDNGQTPLVDSASVSISDSINNFSFKYINGFYIPDSNFIPEIGKTYTMSIKLKNGEEYIAVEKIRPLPIIDSVRCFPYISPYSKKTRYYINIYGKDIPGNDNSYEFIMYLNGIIFSDTLREITFSSGIMSNSPIFKGLRPVYVLREEQLPDSVTIVIETRSISFQYYEFVNELLSQSVWRGGFFETPPANIKSSNITPVNNTKKAFGYFTASAVRRDTVFVEKKKLFLLLNK